jgi:probable HAF family extracellular repeat protein
LMHDLGTLGGDYSVANDINANGDVTGWSFSTVDVLESHAFLYINGAHMVDLNTCIDPALNWVLQNALAINDAGQITGYGLVNGEARAFLLTPVPEPNTLMLSIVIAAVAIFGRQTARISEPR